MYLILIGLAYIVGGVLQGDLTHFTWWNILIFLVWCMLGPYRKGIELTTLILNFTVILVVVIMSLSGCTMLQNAYSDFGPEEYGIGNFIVHYVPSLVIIWFGDHDLTSEQLQQQGILAAAFLALYLSYDTFTDVYGCDLPEQAAELFVLVILLLAYTRSHLNYFLIYTDAFPTINLPDTGFRSADFM